MAAMDRPRFTVIGGGLGGPLMAIYLGRSGYPVEVYERRADPRRAQAEQGRSINLAISTRGIHALGQAGLAEEILAVAVPMRGRMIHSSQGDLTFQPYGTDPGHCINSVSRADLNIALLNAAERFPNVRVFFGKKCSGVDVESASVLLSDVESGESVSVTADVVVGADGAFSAVRHQMQKMDRFDFEQTYLEWGYKELEIPPGPGGEFRLERNALHIWPRGGYMMIALPNRDGSFTVTCFWPVEGPHSFAALKTEDDVRRYFNETFPDAVPLMPTLAGDFFRNPTASLVTIRCRPWYFRDKMVLLGDACHAVVPFYGQGANASFEDCVVLDECLREHAPDREKAFASYQERRKRNADALADLSLANFVEMRDRTASRAFLAIKKTEKILNRLFPSWFVPLYTMVTFSRIPYAEAVERSKRQWLVVGLGVAAMLSSLGLLLLLWVPLWK